MALAANGSRICDTDRVALVGIDVNHTLANNTDLIIFALGTVLVAGDEVKGGDSHTWQFRRVGGTFADITLASEVKMADTASLVNASAITEAERRANAGGTYIDCGREFESANPQTKRSTAKDDVVIETQIGLSFADAPGSQQYEFQVIWTEKTEGPVPIIAPALITTASAGAAGHGILLAGQRNRLVRSE